MVCNDSLASKCSWEVWRESGVRNYHYPEVTTMNKEVDEQVSQGGGRWVFGKADWKKFREVSDRRLVDVDEN